MRILTCVILVLLPCAVPAAFNHGDRVLARWTNHFYYPGTVEKSLFSLISPWGSIKIKFDDGDEITYPIEDKSAVIADKAPDTVDVRDHVMATWKGGSKYHLGFIVELRYPYYDSSDPEYKVVFDDFDSDWYNVQDLRKFPVLDKRQVGARVWGFYGRNGFYYRGFVSKVDKDWVDVLFDDGDTAAFRFADLSDGVVLDELPQAGRSYKNSQVIAYWPWYGKNKFFKGTVTAEKLLVLSVYKVKSESINRWEQMYQLRPMDA